MNNLLRSISEPRDITINQVRDEGFQFFNQNIINLALNSEIPVLERINYLHIVYNNYIEHYSRLSNTKSKWQYYAVIKDFTIFAQEMNQLFNQIDISQLNNFHIETPKLHSHRVSKDDVLVLTTNDIPSFEYVMANDRTNLVFDGIKYVPLTFTNDYSMKYKIDEVGLWSEEYINAHLDNYEHRYIPEVIVWVNINISMEMRNIIADTIDALGYYPVFMNVDLLNCINYKNTDNVPGLLYEEMTHQYYNQKYFDKSNFCDIYRMPYDSFDNVIDLYDQAIHNDNVESIYITIYRTNTNSKLIDTLIQGTKLGKTLNIYVELTARGDERHNYELIKKLKSECIPDKLNLYTSYNGYKIHAKMGLIVMHGGQFICHCATGNFNESTAKLYKDTHIITDECSIVSTVIQSFKCIASKSYIGRLKLKNILRDEIMKEIHKGTDGRIILKCNHLADIEITDLLSLAKDSGCEVKLLPRSTFGYSEDKFGKKIFRGGRFLEHERVYIFGKDTYTRVYLSSSDILFRNLYNRMEFTFRLPDDADITKFVDECYNY